jgi:hypothetical protein
MQSKVFFLGGGLKSHLICKLYIYIYIQKIGVGIGCYGLRTGTQGMTLVGRGGIILISKT